MIERGRCPTLRIDNSVERVTKRVCQRKVGIELRCTHSEHTCRCAKDLAEYPQLRLRHSLHRIPKRPIVDLYPLPLAVEQDRHDHILHFATTDTRLLVIRL